MANICRATADGDVEYEYNLKQLMWHLCYAAWLSASALRSAPSQTNANGYDKSTADTATATATAATTYSITLPNMAKTANSALSVPAFGIFMICLLIGWDVPTTKRQYLPRK